MTAADLLTRMTIFVNELEVDSGGDDEVRALVALDMAQDYFESVAASFPHIGGGLSNIATVADSEVTSWPATLKRVDSMWCIDPSTSRPMWEVLPLHKVGEHAPASLFPFNMTSASSTGAPRYYSHDVDFFYWSPRPDAAYTVRVYGMSTRTALTSRSVTFGWDDEVSVPLAVFATRLLKLGVDDRTDELQAAAEEMFVPVLRSMRKRVRQGPQGRAYTQTHDT